MLFGRYNTSFNVQHDFYVKQKYLKKRKYFLRKRGFYYKKNHFVYCFNLCKYF